MFFGSLTGADEKSRDLDFLPEAMVEEILKKQGEVVKGVGERITDLIKTRENVRAALKELGLLKNFADEPVSHSYPTTAGVDGTFSVIRQLSWDIAAVAALAVEGLTPPKEQRFWEKPYFKLNVFLLKHSTYSLELLRHLMFSYELELATKAPHRVVFLDGSYTSFLIGLKVGFELLFSSQCKEVARLIDEISSREDETINNLVTVLTSPRTDQFFVAIPKYTSRNEVIARLGERGLASPLINEIDDKGLLSIVLEPMEYVGPLPLTQPGERWYFTRPSGNIEEKVVDAMNKLQVFYFRPSRMHPALRVEVSGTIADDKHKLRVIMEALRDQTIRGILEPYPLYIADQFVKHLHGGLAELRETIINDVGKAKDLDLPDFYLALHSYRSESGYE